MVSPARRAVMIGTAMCATAAMVPLARPPSKPGRPPPPAAFPQRFGPWETDLVSRPLVRPLAAGGRVMGFYDGLFEQTFVDARQYRVMLSIAYLSKVFEGASLQVHLPGVCYRYSGYRILSDVETTARILGRSLPAKRMYAHLPGRPEPVTYWIAAGGVVGSHAALRRLRILAALKRESLDGMLVRISSIDSDVTRAFARHVDFAQDLAAAMSTADRPYFIGADEAA